MAILTTNELPTYAPGIRRGNDADILIAQVAIEAWLGFSIEQQERVEILSLTDRSKTAQLSYHPIATTPAPVIEVRQGNERDRLDRQSAVTDWATLQAGDYVLDATGLLSLNTVSSAISFGFRVAASTEARATYTAGINFTQNTAEVNALKAAIGQIITYQKTSLQFATGIKKVRIQDQVEKEYFGGGSGDNALTPGQTPETLFRAFQKYKPRSAILVG